MEGGWTVHEVDCFPTFLPSIHLIFVFLIHHNQFKRIFEKKQGFQKQHNLKHVMPTSSTCATSVLRSPPPGHCYGLEVGLLLPLLGVFNGFA